MTGVAWSFEEPSAAARVVKDFVKENEKLKIKAGLLDGEVLEREGGLRAARDLAEQGRGASPSARHDERPRAAVRDVDERPRPEFVGVLAAKERKEGGG